MGCSVCHAILVICGIIFIYIFFELLTIDIGRFIKSHQFCTLDEVLMSFNYNDDANNCSFCGINL